MPPNDLQSTPTQLKLAPFCAAFGRPLLIPTSQKTDPDGGLTSNRYPVGTGDSRRQTSVDGCRWLLKGCSMKLICRCSSMPYFPNKLPPVHVEQITADHKSYDPASYVNGRVPLPARIRDLEIVYTALSLVAPEKVRFATNWKDETAIGRTPGLGDRPFVATSLHAITVPRRGLQ